MRVIIVMLLLGLAACAPLQQSYMMPRDAHEHIRLRDDTLLAGDEVILPVRSWLPAGKPKAVIIALHGFNDYSRSFENTGIFLKEHNVALFAYDQRGFGQGPHTGIWANEKNLIDDLKQCVEQAKRRYPGVPVYILGESMGGAVAITSLADPEFPKVQGAILSAPAVWGAETMNVVFRGTLWLTAHVMPNAEFTGSDLKILASNNIPMLMRLAADPLVLKKTRADAAYGVVLLMGNAYRKVPEVKTPVLLLYGAKDEVIPRDPIEKTLQRFTVPVRYVNYPEGYHMLTRDIQAQQVMQDILSWIEQPDKPLPSEIASVNQ